MEEELEQERVDLLVGVEDRLPFWQYVVYGFQQVLVESSALTFPVVTGLALGLKQEQIAHMVQAYLVAAGIVTIAQSTLILKLPIVQGPAGSFLAVLIGLGKTAGLAGAWTAVFVAGLLAAAMAWPLRWWSKIRRVVAAPPVYGVLLVLIGLSLTGVVAGLILGKPNTPGYASGAHFFLALLTLACLTGATLYFQRGFLRFAAILLSGIIGSVVAVLMGQASFAPVAKAGWFALPQLLPFGWDLQWGAVFVVFIAYLIAITESMGNYILVGEVMAKQQISDQRIDAGILSEAVGSALGGLIGGSGTTSYGQNIGAISVTGIGSRHVITAAGIIVLLLGLIPKVGAVVSSVPGPVLGGIYILTWGMLIMQGVRVLGRMPFSNTNMTIAGISFMIGMGTYFVPPAALQLLPKSIQAFASSGLILGTLVGIALYVLLHSILRLDTSGRLTVGKAKVGA